MVTGPAAVACGGSSSANAPVRARCRAMSSPYAPAVAAPKIKPRRDRSLMRVPGRLDCLGSAFLRRVYRDGGYGDTDRNVCATQSYPRPPTHITFRGDDWMLSKGEVSRRLTLQRLEREPATAATAWALRGLRAPQVL